MVLDLKERREFKRVMREIEDLWYDEREEEEDSLDIYEKFKHADDNLNLNR